MVKISIIIPTYNVENYLVQCLDSVINQTLKEIEIIIVNDGSEDNSLEIAKQYTYKDNRIILIDKQNEGYGKAVNVGLEAATGEYIGIVEPDDFIELNMYEVLYSKTKIKKFDIVKGSYYYYKTNHFFCDTYIQNIIKEEKEVNVFDWDMQDLWLVNASIWSAIYKREFILDKNIKLLETPGASYQDFPFFCETLFSAKNTYFTPDCFYYYRANNPNSSTHMKNKLILYTIFKTISYIKEKLLNTDKDKYNKYSYLFDCKYIKSILWHISKVSSKYKLNYANYCKKYIEDNELGKVISSLSDLEWGQSYLNLKNLDKMSTLNKYSAIKLEEHKINKFYYLKNSLTDLIVVPGKLICATLKLLILTLKI